MVWDNFRSIFLVQILLLWFHSLIGFVQPALLALVINQLSEALLFDTRLVIWLTLLTLSSTTPSLIYTVQGYYNKIGYLRLEQLLEYEMVKLHGKIDVADHENPKIKDQLNRVHEEGWRIKNFTERTLYIFQDLLSLVIASAILIQAQWWTLPLLLVATLPELIVSNKYGRDIWSISSYQSEDRRFFWDIRYHFTHLPNLLELKLFQNLDSFYSKLTQIFSKFLKTQESNERLRTKRQLAAQALSQAAMAAVVIFFIYRVTQGDLMIGTLTFMIATIGQFRSNLAGFFMNISSQYQDSLFVNDFFALQDLPSQLDYSRSKKKLDPDQTPQIEFKNVSFAYPGSQHQVLSKVNLSIGPGTKLALVGNNGAGKTTFVKLLCRFYDPDQGQILINGTDLREIDLDSWYYHLGILFQEYSRYYFKVSESIEVGRLSQRDKARAIEASTRVGADEFIRKWPLQYRQQLGKEFTNGVEPSIGQWQRLALARVFYRKPSIFVLDEPTASLDAEAEAQIFEYLDSLGDNKTSILISHRFSTVRKADQIVVLERGEITESGTHRELLKLDGKYARLYNLQAKDYRD